MMSNEEKGDSATTPKYEKRLILANGVKALTLSEMRVSICGKNDEPEDDPPTPPSDRFIVDEGKIYYIDMNCNQADFDLILEGECGQNIRQDMIAHAVLAWMDEIQRILRKDVYKVELAKADKELEFWQKARKPC